MSMGKALIIDDEKNIRLTLSKCLKFIDIDVEEAINGEEGVRKIAAGVEPDIIFLDLKMQGMDGVETLRHIREINKTVPVVIVTAHGTVDSAVEAMKLGAADFMQKPFTPQEIQDIVREVLDRRNLQQEELDTGQAHLQYAKQLISSKDYDGAIEQLKKAIGLEPLGAEPHNIIGAIMEIRGNLEEAEKYYQAAIALDPAYHQAQRNLTRLRGKIKGTPAYQDSEIEGR